MSMIASFYVLNRNAIFELKEKAGLPVGKQGGKWVDPFWNYLFASGRELEEYEGAGSAFVHLVTFLNVKSIALEDFTEPDLTQFFCNTRGDSHFIFDDQGAKKLEGVLASTPCDLQEIIDFLKNEDPDFSPEAVVAANEFLRRWLKQMSNGEYGLLSIG